MLFFVNDYAEGAHPEILKRLEETNLEKTVGYGLDEYCKSAEEKIKKACGAKNADVYFTIGGTQTNQVVIDTMTEAYEGVVAVDSGHVNVHEAGAIEYSGHKVLTVPNKNGKMDAKDLTKLLEDFYADEDYEHEVFPGIVYISHPTEKGTLYTKSELTELHNVCKKYDIPLYLDGARLAYGLMAKKTDVTLKDIAKLTDVFYIGGTKCGAFFGEAIVFTKNNMPKRFNTRVKQHGAMLAKGRLLGLMFDTFFTNDLYFRCGENAIETAEVLKKGLKKKGYKFYVNSPTNQIYIIVNKKKEKELSKIVEFSFWENIDKDHKAIRFCTSWATKMEDVEKLIELL